MSIRPSAGMTTRSKISRSMQKAVWIRQFGDHVSNGTCPYCKCVLSQFDAHYDHIVPLAEGGSHEVDNIQVLCMTCNTSKSKRRKEEVEREHGIPDAFNEIDYLITQMHEMEIKDRCAAINKNGERCKRAVGRGKIKYCGHHSAR